MICVGGRNPPEAICDLERDVVENIEITVPRRCSKRPTAPLGHVDYTGSRTRDIF